MLIECTATDLTKANIVLDNVVTMFSQYCAVPYSVLPVKVQYEQDGNIVDFDVAPKLSTRRESASNLR